MSFRMEINLSGLCFVELQAKRFDARADEVTVWTPTPSIAPNHATRLTVRRAEILGSAVPKGTCRNFSASGDDLISMSLAGDGSPLDVSVEGLGTSGAAMLWASESMGNPPGAMDWLIDRADIGLVGKQAQHETNLECRFRLPAGQLQAKNLMHYRRGPYQGQVLPWLYPLPKTTRAIADDMVLATQVTGDRVVFRLGEFELPLAPEGERLEVSFSNDMVDIDAVGPTGHNPHHHLVHLAQAFDQDIDEIGLPEEDAAEAEKLYGSAPEPAPQAAVASVGRGEAMMRRLLRTSGDRCTQALSFLEE